ncbi:KH domain-containing protein [Leucobacter sp. OH1287]|uniref:KH domain-containing protein n=1 Tax=Leucobacter sp. OH1287 TaxID=2491049 RepID=UPI000F5E3F93|nr:KH domain-containing protein [Leucobacter sp. OH1287]RRD60501.1 KH domain-containing protein [Leucobacter sp. OH1287]
MAAVALHEALAHLVCGIVENPDDVEVTVVEGGRVETLEVRVNPADLGRVIGRSGRTVQALRTVINALARGHRVRIDVIDTDE